MKALLWSKHFCPYCEQAKRELEKRGYEIEERKIGSGWTRENLLESVPDARTVPQIFIDGEYVGGFTELKTKLGIQ
jgi:glutaredoxin